MKGIIFSSDMLSIAVLSEEIWSTRKGSFIFIMPPIPPTFRELIVLAQPGKGDPPLVSTTILWMKVRNRSTDVAVCWWMLPTQRQDFWGNQHMRG